MPRQALLDAPKLRIMSWCAGSSVIFADDRDKTRFLERLGQNVINGNVRSTPGFLWITTLIFYSRAVGMVSRHVTSSSCGTPSTLTAAIAASYIYYMSLKFFSQKTTTFQFVGTIFSAKTWPQLLKEKFASPDKIKLLSQLRPLVFLRIQKM